MVRQLQTNWASVDLSIARLYANLVEDESVRESIYSLVQAEYEATAKALAEIDGDDWQQRRLRLHKTLSERADGLQLLHQRQVELLAAWRTCLRRRTRSHATRSPTHHQRHHRRPPRHGVEQIRRS